MRVESNDNHVPIEADWVIKNPTRTPPRSRSRAFGIVKASYIFKVIQYDSGNVLASYQRITKRNGTRDPTV